MPDGHPVEVARAGWPPAFDAVLDVLPGVVRADDAEWRPGKAPAPVVGWTPFASGVTWFEVGIGPADKGPSPLWPAGRLPAPGAVVNRWRGLPAGGAPLYLAGDAAVVDRVTGVDATGVRFGFSPEDSDLPATAGWPVLFADLLEATRRDRARCRMADAGDPMLLAAPGDVRVTRPGGEARVLSPVEGHVVVDGLDTTGIFRVESGGRTAALAVVPPLDVSTDDDDVAIAAPDAPTDAHRLVPALAAAALLLVALGWSRRWRSAVAWLAVAAALGAIADWRVGPGGPGPIVVAVDVSDSMPPGDTAKALAALQAELGPLRVEGAGDVRRAGELVDPPRFGGAATRHAPLLAAAATLAGPRGAVVLLSDGRAADGPVASPIPVFPLAVGLSGPDASVADGRAVRIGGRVHVRGTVQANDDVLAHVRVGAETVDVPLRAGRPRTVHAALALAPDVDAVELRVEVDGDPLPVNDALPVPVEGDGEARAIVLGEGAAGWARAAGFEVEAASAAGLVEGAADLGTARAVFVHDQPAERLPAAAVDRLEGFVVAGGMLVLAGRERAFGPGGWAGTRLEAISPLVSDPSPPGAGRLGVVLLLDRSGSMAREAGGIGPEGVGALAGSLAAGLRGPGDQLAVVAFGGRGAGEYQLLLSPTPPALVVGDALPVPAIARGGTAFAPGMTKAAALLESVDVDRRLIVAITDGQVVDQPEPALVERLKRSDIRLLVVLVGDDPVREPFAGVAEATGGRVVQGSGDALPRIITGGLLDTARNGLLVPGGPVATTPAWQARVGVEPPPIEGRVRAGAQPEAQVLARAGGEPFVAEWAYGRGRVLAIATDAWALGADGFTALLAPARAAPPNDALLYVEDGRLHLEGAPWDPPPPGPAQVFAAGGAVTEVAWRPEGPGRAVAELPPGPVEILRVVAATARGAVQARVTRPPLPELAHVGVDAPALALQAAVTGGEVLTGPDALQPVSRAVRRASGTPLAPWLALLAAALAVLEAAGWAGLGRAKRHVRHGTTGETRSASAAS